MADDQVGPFIETAPEGFVALSDGSYVSAEHIIRVAPAGEHRISVYTTGDIFEVAGEAYEVAAAASEALRGPPEVITVIKPKPEKPVKPVGD